jgi:plasmid stabilization system protein ParE
VIFHGCYAIYYVPREDELVVVRVLHSARDVTAIAEHGGFEE